MNPGPDTKIGSDKATGAMGTYFWSVITGKPASGKYYATIKAEDGCEGDRSNVFAINE